MMAMMKGQVSPMLFRAGNPSCRITCESVGRKVVGLVCYGLTCSTYITSEFRLNVIP